MLGCRDDAGHLTECPVIVFDLDRERELRKEAVSHLLDKIGSADTEVVLSDAPYRG